MKVSERWGIRSSARRPRRVEGFKECFPASALITVSGLAVPGLLVEVQGIAVIGEKYRRAVFGLSRFRLLLQDQFAPANWKCLPHRSSLVDVARVLGVREAADLLSRFSEV
jgi:hypothetical protein